MRIGSLKLKGQSIEGLLLLLFSIILFYKSVQLNTFGSWILSPGLFPLIISIILFCLSAALILTDKSFIDEKEKKKNDETYTIVIMISIVSFVYVYILPKIHFITSSILYIFSLQLILGERKWYALMLVSITSTLILYFVFNNLLNVILP